MFVQDLQATWDNTDPADTAASVDDVFNKINASATLAAVNPIKSYVLQPEGSTLQDILGGYFFDLHGVATDFSAVPSLATTGANPNISQLLCNEFWQSWTQTIATWVGPAYVVWLTKPAVFINYVDQTAVIRARLATNVETWRGLLLGPYDPLKWQPPQIFAPPAPPPAVPDGALAVDSLLLAVDGLTLAVV